MEVPKEVQDWNWGLIVLYFLSGPNNNRKELKLNIITIKEDLEILSFGRNLLILTLFLNSMPKIINNN